MMLRFLLLFVLTALHSGVFARDLQKEKLLKRIRQTSDTLRVQAFLDYGYWFESQNLDSSAYYYKKAGELSSKLDYTAGLMKYYANYTYILNQQGKTSQSLKLNLEALEIANKSKNQLYIADCLFNVGSSYNNAGNYDKAVIYYTRSARSFEKMGRTQDLAMVYDNIGGVFTNIGEYKQALPYNTKALHTARKTSDKSLLAKTLINTAITQSFVGMYREAEKNATEGLSLAEKIGNTYLQSIALNTLAGIDFKKHESVSGLKYAQRSLELAEKIDSKYSKMESLKLLASGYLDMKQFDSSIVYAEKAIGFGSTYRFKSDHHKLYEILSLAYAGKGKYNLAYDAQKVSVRLKDSISESKLKEKVKQLEATYENAKNREQIYALKGSASQQRYLISFLLVVLIAAILLAVVIYMNIRQKKRNTETDLLSEKKKLEQLQKEQQLIAAESILKGQEEERTRLARDLHDGLGGLLSGIKLTLADSKGESSEKALVQLDNAVEEMRRMAHSMMPESLVRFGLADALGDFCATVNHSPDLNVHLQVFRLKKRPKQTIEIAVYRIVQELVTNAIKHGNATEILVQLVQNENVLSLTVEDNGTGFDPQKSSNGIGLMNIRSRVGLLNGTIDIQSERGIGTTFMIEIENNG